MNKIEAIDIEKAKKEPELLFQFAANNLELIITQDNKPLYKITQIEPTKKRRQKGSAKGLIFMSDDFDEILEEFKEYI
jgi:antitoxin (DNA-binding transcriptional repressor) of toxin-antitoxin stability system